MAANTLFLDFDGTLLPTSFEQYQKTLVRLYPQAAVKDRYGPFFSPGCVSLLGDLVRSYDFDLVVTSRWNQDMSFEKLVSMWQERGYPGKLIGTTTPVVGALRGDEIEQWLLANPALALRPYLILDDMGPEGFHPAQRARLVLVEPMLGFTLPDYQRAVGTLLGPI